MLNGKFGFNRFGVYVTKPYTYEELKTKCKWLGNMRFQCGKCKIGYFNVYNENNHDQECPECKYYVVIKWQD